MNANDKAREYILDAAAHLIQEGGVDALTFTDIAEVAEIEQSEVETIFPTLDRLVQDLLERMFDTFIARIGEEVGTDETPGAWLRAYIRASLPEDESEAFFHIAAVMLQSVVYKPQLIDAVRNRQAELHSAMLSDGIDDKTAAVVRLAVDGLWMSKMFEFAAVPPRLETDIKDHLTVMASK